jgi:N-acetylmuramic acid 6-phosphate etherase
VLDGVELLPTFSWPSERALGLLAGGSGAMFLAVEGAEDDAAQGQADIRAVNPTPQDVVIGIAASGTTPYVLGALQAGHAAGALTIGLTNNPGTPVAQQAQIGIVLDTGPEVISGSTRLKAGTAQKIALNTLSSALMVRMHKVHGNLMVDLRATNAKLVRRAEQLTVMATGTSVEHARQALQACGYRVKVAIVMLLAGVDAEAAQQRLDRSRGRIEDAVR